MDDLDLDEYYTSAMDPHEMLLKDATFRWAKTLSKEERNKLHSKKKKSKHKGKRKVLLASNESEKQIETITEDQQDADRVFRLSKINVSVKKVGKIKEYSGFDF